MPGQLRGTDRDGQRVAEARHPSVDRGKRRVRGQHLAGDQIDVGQYFSYPGRKFRYIAEEYLEPIPDSQLPVVRNCIAWLRCTTFEVKPMADHELFFARIVAVGAGRLKEPPLLYSSRLGWRVTGDKAREPGRSIRDELLERLAAAGFGAPEEPDDEE